MIRRMKRRQKHRHSVRPEGVRLRWKVGGQWVQWNSPKYRTGSLVITLSPQPLDIVGAEVSPDIFVSAVHVRFSPDVWAL